MDERERAEKTKEFWELYNGYIANGDRTSWSKLSELLALIEEKSRGNQLLDPNNGRTKIIAWQVLRNQDFLFPRGDQPFRLYAGELLYESHWDRDVFLTRIPKIECVSGDILHPGYYCGLEQKEKQNMSDDDWKEFCNKNMFADERGLYLPLYEKPIVKSLCMQEIEDHKKILEKYLQDEVFF